ncbi:MAG: hypothetical protein E6J20_17405 [Chloroflexi bacterium]|nr:MAG: hypothetical protein E6J20_17405 [Chloroflexota bacterium]
MTRGPGSPRRRTSRAADPGTLQLLAPPPLAPPARIVPEVAVPCSDPFDATGWRFTVDWEGMRVLLATGPDGEVRLQDERLRDVTGLFPEVVAAAAALGRRTAVIDGVVAVVDQAGHPDLAGLVHRIHAGPARPVAGAVVYLAADLLHLDSSPVAAWPLDRRQEALAILVPPHPRLQVPGWVEGHGRAFCDAAADHGLSGVLARRGSAPYRAGMASPDRLRIALAEQVDAVVAGVVWAAAPRSRRGAARPLPTAVLLAEWEAGHLVDAGRAGVHLDTEAQAWLTARAAELGVAEPPCPVAVDPGEAVAWLRPGVVATVVHHGRDEAGRLRLPGLVAVRDDRDPAWCIRRAPVAPPEDTPLPSGPGFRPTVLHTLPLGDG